jgi:16S rRNA (guanine(527)-N(7))-methyltransferase RsmG
MIDINTAKRLLAKQNLYFLESMVEKLLAHACEVERFGVTLGLTKDIGDLLWLRHSVDSLLALSYIQGLNPKIVLDMGSGAGFPGVPLAIAMADTNFILAERKQKRLSFLQGTIALLSLSNVAVTNDINTINTPIDVVTFRALSSVTSNFLNNVKKQINFKYIVAYTGKLDLVNKQASELNNDGFDVKVIKLPYAMGERSLLVIDNN